MLATSTGAKRNPTLSALKMKSWENILTALNEQKPSKKEFSLAIKRTFSRRCSHPTAKVLICRAELYSEN